MGFTKEQVEACAMVLHDLLDASLDEAADIARAVLAELEPEEMRDDLAEARAQIAAKDAEIERLRTAHENQWEELKVFMSSDALLTNEVLELRAQIAAKDALLQECLDWFDAPFESDVKSDMEMAMRVRDALRREA